MKIYIDWELARLKADIYIFEIIFEDGVCDELLEELINDPPDNILSYRLLLEEEELDDMIARANKYIASGKKETEIPRLVIKFAEFFKDLYKRVPDGGITAAIKRSLAAQSDAAATKEEEKDE